MPLPPGVVDPIFMHELAEHLHMTVGELGSRMSLHELTVAWPAYFDYKRRRAEREEFKASQRRTF